MLETVLAVLLGLAIRDIFTEGVGRYNQYKYKKSMKNFYEMIEDLEADDEE